jgi:hypothetical protein
VPPSLRFNASDADPEVTVTVFTVAVAP